MDLTGEIESALESLTLVSQMVPGKDLMAESKSPLFGIAPGYTWHLDPEGRDQDPADDGSRLPQPSPYHTWVVRGRGRLLAGQNSPEGQGGNGTWENGTYDLIYRLFERGNSLGDMHVNA